MLKSNDNTLVYVLIAIIVIYIICNRMKETFLSSGTNLKGCYKLDQNMCSVDCCGKQWPVSFDMKKDPRIKEGELGSKYLPTNMSCTGKMGTGCICASNQQYQFLTDRGTNAPACRDEGSGYKLLQK